MTKPSASRYNETVSAQQVMLFSEPDDPPPMEPAADKDETAALVWAVERAIQRADGLPAKKRDYLSASRLSLLSKCGIQYEFRYVRHIRTPSGVGALVGKSVHATVASDMRWKRERGELLSEAEIRDTAADSLAEEWAKGEVELSPEDLAAGVAVVRGEAIDRSVRLAVHHHLTAAQIIQPIAVEQSWTLELPGFPFDLVGRTDVEEADIVRDTKTRMGRKPPARIAQDDDQLTMYALKRRIIDRKPFPIRVAFDFIVDYKTGPDYQPIIAERDGPDLEVQLARIQNAWDVIQKGAFTPANQTDWWCSAKYCSYHAQCPFARHPKQFAITNFITEANDGTE